MKTLTHKQRVLLYTVFRLSERGQSSKFMLMKDLFLLSQEEKLGSFIKFYHFFPYKFGPFSNSCYVDLAELIREGFIVEKDNLLNLTEKGIMASSTVDTKVKFRVNRVINRFTSERSIRDYVYSNFPDYTIKSELLPKKETAVEPAIFTIGYEGKDIDQFLNILVTFRIDTVIDVRKNPFSMKFNFTKKKLNYYLQKLNLLYLHFPELGIDGDKRKNLLTIEDYKSLFENYEQTVIEKEQDAISQICSLGQKNRIVLMCFEEDINTCHRGIIAKNIIETRNLEVTHI